MALSRAPDRIVKATSARSHFFDIACGRHGDKDLGDFFQGRHPLIPPRRRHAQVLVGGREIVRVIRVERRPEARLAGQPEEEVAKVLQGRGDGRGAERLPILPGFLQETGAEGAGLLHVEFAERLPAGRDFEALDGAQGRVDGSILLAIRRLQKKGVVALHALVFRVVFLHGFLPPFKVRIAVGIVCLV